LGGRGQQEPENPGGKTKWKINNRLGVCRAVDSKAGLKKNSWAGKKGISGGRQIDPHIRRTFGEGNTA